MKRPKPVALIGAGRLTDTPVADFRGLPDLLGPVKSPSFRLASRIANSLRAGYAVKEYAELDGCRLILISVPDEMLPKLIQEMLSVEMNWANKAVLLCSAGLDSSELAGLAERGAAIGSVSPVAGLEDDWYLVEGDKSAIRQSRKVLEHSGRRVLAIERSLKPLYLSAMTCTGSLLFALLLVASESLRHAGVPAYLAGSILEKQLGKTLRTYLKAGRKAYPSTQQLSGQLTALVKADPALAEYVEQGAELAGKLLLSAAGRKGVP